MASVLNLRSNPLGDLDVSRRRRRLGAASTTGLVLASSVGLLVGMGGPAGAATAVSLGTAGSFAVLAGSGITNTGTTTVTGDIGTFPTTTNSGGGFVLAGVDHGGDAVTQGAKSDLLTAYGVVAGQASSSSVSADLAGRTLTAGVYTAASSMGLSGALTLDAAGNPDAVFVFQAGSTLTTGSSSAVVLVNGAQACNVYWQVGSSAMLGTSTHFRGNILAETSITLTTGATVEGRVLANNGAVTLDSNVITRPACTPPVTPPSAPAGSPPAGPTESLPSTVGTGPDSGSGSGSGSADGAGSAGQSGRNGRQVSRAPVGAVDTGDGSTVRGTWFTDPPAGSGSLLAVTSGR